MHTAACLSALALVLASSCYDGGLRPVCASDLPCWVDTDQRVRVLEGDDRPDRTHPTNSRCVLGKTECVAGEAQCVGYLWDPQPEACNGVDDNCNGDVDEGTGYGWFEGENPCEGVGACALQDQKCLAGVLECVPVFLPSEETCNGIDDDCDGDTDEIEPALYWPEDAPPLSEVYLGPGSQCSVGLERCREGEPVIEGLRTPSAETCDGVDNDCNGLVDDTGDEDSTAVVLVLDYSGSMTGHLSSVRSSLCSWGVRPQDRFAVIAIGMAGFTEQIVTEIGPGFVSHADLCAYLYGDPWAGNWGGTEWQSLGIMQAADFDWPHDYRRVVVVVTDEAAQWYSSALPPETASACLDAGLTVHIFAPPDHLWDWTPIRPDCPGDVFVLDSSLTSDLNNAIAGACAP